jgi:hypothetical protein
MTVATEMDEVVLIKGLWYESIMGE